MDTKYVREISKFDKDLRKLSSEFGLEIKNIDIAFLLEQLTADDKCDVSANGLTKIEKMICAFCKSKRMKDPELFLIKLLQIYAEYLGVSDEAELKLRPFRAE